MLSNVSPAFSKASYTIAQHVVISKRVVQDSSRDTSLTNFKHFSLRWVHGFYLTTRDPEKAVIEEPSIFFQEKRPPCGQRTWAVRIIVKQCLHGEMWLAKLPPTLAVIFEELP